MKNLSGKCNNSCAQQKNGCPYYVSPVWCAQIGTTFLFKFVFCSQGRAVFARWETAGPPHGVRLSCLRHRNICGIQHIFDKYSIPRGRIVDQRVGDSSHELSVLLSERMIFVDFLSFAHKGIPRMILIHYYNLNPNSFSILSAS